MTNKTWAIIAKKSGGHVHCTARRGIEGGRALLGTITFDLSDIQALREDLELRAAQLITGVIADTVVALGVRGAFKGYDHFALMAATKEIGEQLREVRVYPFLDQLAQTFGLQILEDA